MGFLGSIRKKSPLFRMAKRKRPETLSLASTTCDFSQDTDLMEIDDPKNTDTEELLTPKERIESFDDRPIMVSDEEGDMDARLRTRSGSRTRFFNDNNDTVDANTVTTRKYQNDERMLEVQENEDMQEDDAFREETQEEYMVQEDRNYVSSGDEADAEDEGRLSQREVPPRRTHVRIPSDGPLMHIFHDELATLYEEPNKSDSSEAEAETGSLKTLDESNIRARWDYALRLMVGQCDASLYNTIAEMIPGITEVAEI
jgi:hypothetical protein